MPYIDKKAAKAPFVLAQRKKPAPKTEEQLIREAAARRRRVPIKPNFNKYKAKPQKVIMPTLFDEPDPVQDPFESLQVMNSILI